MSFSCHGLGVLAWSNSEILLKQPKRFILVCGQGTGPLQAEQHSACTTQARDLNQVVWEGIHHFYQQHCSSVVLIMYTVYSGS
jgi:hypothetical protein